jgi:indole-3-glycerol phosphate synthase
MSPPPTLDEILTRARRDAEKRWRAADVAALERRADESAASRRPLRRALERSPFTVIAEMKRASPSAGTIRRDLDPAALARAYEEAGAAALSVLTCGAWFLGSPDDLSAARAAVAAPVLCKDFVVIPFQLFEAAAAGADAVLLIAAALADRELRALAGLAKGLRLEILFEAHDAGEIARLVDAGAELIGVNSRNLKTMEVASEEALALAAGIPRDACAVFESGVKRGEDLRAAAAAGFRAALVGETLLRAADPGGRLRQLLMEAGGA